MLKFLFGWSKKERHVSEDDLLLFADGELATRKLAWLRAHLEHCWQCRVRAEKNERVISQLVDYLNCGLAPRLPAPPHLWHGFDGQLQRAVAQRDKFRESASPRWGQARAELRLPGIPMNPLLASSLVAAAAVVIIFLIWQRSLPPVSAAELIARAEFSDATAGKAREPGVLYRRVRIKTPHTTIERDLYRDRQGRRRPRAEQLEPELASLQPRLASAGIDLDEPLSAATYKDWHDRQLITNDKVERSGDHELTLTTTTDSGLARQASLTVREGDFHPIRRTVNLPETGTVEIAELTYAVVSWSAINPELFEPLSPPTLVSRPGAHPATRVALPTGAQLDVAELEALVALNHLHADTTEQIRVRRSSAGIDVFGVVETEQRQREISAQLRSIPYVNPSILSIEDLKQHPPASSEITSVKAYSLSDQKFPLQDFLKQSGTMRDDLGHVSQVLLDTCLQVEQKAKALSSLFRRFPNPDQLAAEPHSNLEQLASSYSSGIEAGLDLEVATLHDLGFADPPGGPVTDDSIADSSALLAEVRRNELLCQELIATNDSNPRPAPTIASDLLSSVARIRLAVRKVSTSVQVVKSQ